MRKFKYVGTQKWASSYDEPIPIIGKVYNENDIISHATVLYYVDNIHPTLAMEWEEVFEPKHNPFNLTFEDKVEIELTKIKDLLL
jgi:hypothetical protein